MVDCISFVGKLLQSTINWVSWKQKYNYLTVLEVRIPKSRCWQGRALSETCKEESFLISCCDLPAGRRVPWLIATALQSCLHHHMVCCLCVSVSPLLIRRLILLDWEHTIVQNDLIFNLLHLEQAYFQIRSHSEVLGVKTWTLILEGLISNYSKYPMPWTYNGHITNMCLDANNIPSRKCQTQ